MLEERDEDGEDVYAQQLSVHFARRGQVRQRQAARQTHAVVVVGHCATSRDGRVQSLGTGVGSH